MVSQKTLVCETGAGVDKPLSFSSSFRNALCSLSRTPSHAIPLEHPGLCSDHDDLGHWTSAASYATMAPSNPPPRATLGGQQVWGWHRCRDMDVSILCRGRCQMRCRVLMAVMGILLAIATVATAEQIGALMTGYEETPAAVSTTGRGEFTATIDADGDASVYTATYSGLQGPVTQSHIHVGQLGVSGSVVIFLCQTAANPDPTGLAPQCPQEGTVSGTITAANVIAGSTASQQLVAGDLAAVITAIRAGAAYANVHTNPSPGGEIRGQLRTI